MSRPKHNDLKNGICQATILLLSYLEANEKDATERQYLKTQVMTLFNACGWSLGYNMAKADGNDLWKRLESIAVTTKKRIIEIMQQQQEQQNKEQQEPKEDQKEQNEITERPPLTVVDGGKLDQPTTGA